MLGMGAKICLIFATEALAARILLPERYGLITWGLFLLNILCMVFGLGLNTATRRFLPMYMSKKDLRSVRGIVLQSSVLSFLGGVVGGICLFFGVRWLSISVMGDEREIMILLAFVFALPLWTLQKTMLAVIGGFKLPVYKVLIEDIFIPGGFLIVVLFAWMFQWNEIPIARGYVLVYLVSAILSMLVVWTRTPFKGTYIVKPKYHTGEIFRFSWPLIFSEPFGKFTGLIDILIIGVLATTYDIGIYRTASDMAVIMSVILLCFGFMYFPMVSEFVAKNDYVQWNDMNKRIARWCMLSCFPIFATLICFSREIIYIIYGEEYVSAAPVLRILAVAYFGHVMVGFTGMNLEAAGLTKTQLTAHLVSFGINAVGNFILIPIYGIQGAAVASLGSIWMVNGICLFVMRRQLRLQPFDELYVHSFMILSLVAVGGLSVIRLFSFLPNVVLILLFFTLCTCSIVWLCFRGYLIDSTDRGLISSMTKGLRLDYLKSL